MDKKVIFKASDLDKYLTDRNKKDLKQLDLYYSEAIEIFKNIEKKNQNFPNDLEKESLITIFDKIEKYMKEAILNEPRIKVYLFKTPLYLHGETSQTIAKLRDSKTDHQEFIYYTQKAYELLFNLILYEEAHQKQSSLIVKTPVTSPSVNFAVHKIPYIDEKLKNSVMCVMLRGALLPSIVLSNRIEEYSLNNYITPFALFKIKRNELKKESNMEYILDLEKSYFDINQLDNKDLIFADPMNATGGSFITIIKYLLSTGIKPKSIKFINVISSLKGTLRVIRAIDNVTIYTLWLDPSLNELAYILPGLGDAGDRLQGEEEGNQQLYKNDIMKLIKCYGSGISALYKNQLKKIEEIISSTD